MAIIIYDHIVKLRSLIRSKEETLDFILNPYKMTSLNYSLKKTDMNLGVKFNDNKHNFFVK